MRIFVALTLCLVFSGCGNKTKRIEGDVINIYGSLPGLVQSSGALFGNESVRINTPSLVYTIKVGEDIYTLNIVEGYKVPRVTLVPRVCIGTRISFVVRDIKAKDSKVFNPNHLAGSNSADDIGVAKPCIH